MNIENCTINTFDSIAVDTMIKKCNKSEEEAINILKDMYNTIDIFSDECMFTKGIYSIRHAIMNRINKM